MAKRNIEYLKISRINSCLPTKQILSGHYLRMVYKGVADKAITVAQIEALQAEITAKCNGAIKELEEYKSGLKKIDNE